MEPKTYGELRKNILTAINKVNYVGTIGGLTYMNGIEHIAPDMAAFYSTAMSILPKTFGFSGEKAEYFDYGKYEFVINWAEKFVNDAKFSFCDNGGEDLYNKTLKEVEEIVGHIFESDPQLLPENKEKNNDFDVEWK